MASSGHANYEFIRMVGFIFQAACDLYRSKRLLKKVCDVEVRSVWLDEKKNFRTQSV